MRGLVKLLAVTSMVAVVTTPMAAPPPGGRAVAMVTQVSGVAWLSRGGVRSPIATDTPVQAGDTLATGPGAVLRGHFADGSEVSLTGNTTLRVDAFRMPQPASAGAGQVKLSLLAGGLYRRSGLIGQPPDVSTVTTPLGTIASGNSEYAALLCGCDGQASGLHLRVFNGAVQVQNAFGAAEVPAGRIAFVAQQAGLDAPGGPPTPADPSPDAIAARAPSLAPQQAGVTQASPATASPVPPPPPTRETPASPSTPG